MEFSGVAPSNVQKKEVAFSLRFVKATESPTNTSVADAVKSAEVTGKTVMYAVFVSLSLLFSPAANRVTEYVPAVS